MENIDVEKLERKNIYTVPEGFFESVQENVLQEILPAKKAKIIKLNWIYSAAAAVALVFGLTYFVNDNPKETESPTIVQNEVANVEAEEVEQLHRARIVGNEEENKNQPEIIPSVQTKKMTADEKQTLAVANKKSNGEVKAPNKNTSRRAEIPMDQIVASFTSADFAELGKNSEQDVYLDLYN